MSVLTQSTKGVLEKSSDLPNENCRKIAQNASVDLSQDIPDILTDSEILKNLQKSGNIDCPPLIHQYTRPAGHPRLVSALAELYNDRLRHKPSLSGPIREAWIADSFDSKRSVDSLTEIIISPGSCAALSTIMLALINPGDEVIFFEPASTNYVPKILSAGGIPISVPLRPSKTNIGPVDSSYFLVDLDELESEFSPKSKMLILNSPSTPIGKVFSFDELQALSSLCIRWNIICLADEVSEFLVLPPHEHVKIASLPGMWNRTLTVGSAEQTFLMTGWQIAWTVGPARLVRAMQLIQQNTIYTCATPLQEALAVTIENELPYLLTGKSFFYKISHSLLKKASRLRDALNEVGMTTIFPQAGHFLLANIENMPLPISERDGGVKNSRAVCFIDWMYANKGILAFPQTKIFCKNHRNFDENFLRFSVAKTEDAISTVVELLKRW